MVPLDELLCLERAQGAFGVLLLFFFLTWELATRVCALWENSASWALRSCLLFCVMLQKFPHPENDNFVFFVMPPTHLPEDKWTQLLIYSL